MTNVYVFLAFFAVLSWILIKAFEILPSRWWWVQPIVLSLWLIGSWMILCQVLDENKRNKKEEVG